MGDEVQVPRIDGGSGPSGKGADPADVSGAGCSDRKGARQQGSCTCVGIESSDRQSIGSNEEDKRSVVAQTAAGIFSSAEKVLGEAFLGEGVFLRGRSRPGDRRSDQGLH